MVQPYVSSFSEDFKLINFYAPNYLIKSFDNLVKFKRVSRTSMLIHLMSKYIRDETQEMKRDNTLDLMLTELGERNKTQNTSQHPMPSQLQDTKKTESYWEPPSMLIVNDDDDDWRF